MTNDPSDPKQVTRRKAISQAGLTLLGGAIGGGIVSAMLGTANADPAKPKDGKDDPDMLAAWTDMNTLPTAEGRQAAFAAMQKLALERVYALPFGSFTKVQGVRSNISGFVPFRIPRLANVAMKN